MSESIRGCIDLITYYNHESGYLIARLVPEGKRERITVVGTVAALKEGETIEVEGAWVNHSKYGRQFKIETYRQVHPSTLEGIQKYLGSGLIKGIGPVSAQRIVDHFGGKTLEIIDADPYGLLEVENLGKNRVELIARAWKDQRRIKDVMVFLQSHGITTGYAVKIFKQYGQEAIQRVRENPYRLERDIVGIGFRIADRIARNMGLAADAPERIQAGNAILAQSGIAEEGHVFLPVEVLMRTVQGNSGGQRRTLSSRTGNPASDDDGIVQRGLALLPATALLRRGWRLASSLKRLLRTPAAVKLDSPCPQAGTGEGLQLSPEPGGRP